jgi:predicted transcriptional regulator
MKTKTLAHALERVESWPAEAQDELAKIAMDIDAGLAGDLYEPTPEELAGIDRGLRAAADGRFASDEQVEAVFAKFRKA